MKKAKVYISEDPGIKLEYKKNIVNKLKKLGFGILNFGFNDLKNADILIHICNNNNYVFREKRYYDLDFQEYETIENAFSKNIPIFFLNRNSELGYSILPDQASDNYLSEDREESYFQIFGMCSKPNGDAFNIFEFLPGYITQSHPKKAELYLQPIKVKYKFKIGDTFINNQGDLTSIKSILENCFTLKSSKGTIWYLHEDKLLQRIKQGIYTDYKPVNEISKPNKEIFSNPIEIWML